MARRKDGRPRNMPASYYSTEEYVRGEQADLYDQEHFLKAPKGETDE
jgi:hypothetical protein